MNILSKTGELVKRHQNALFLLICMLLLGFSSFNLGKIFGTEKGEIEITQEANIFEASEIVTPTPREQGIMGTARPKPILDLRVVGSKNSDKYHFLWCSGAKRIKEENKIWFASEAEAQRAGYTLAGNCEK